MKERISAAQERQALQVEAKDRMEGTSSFVMIVAIRAAGRLFRPGIWLRAEPDGTAIFSLSNCRPEEDDGGEIGWGTKCKVECLTLFVQFHGFSIEIAKTQ